MRSIRSVHKEQRGVELLGIFRRCHLFRYEVFHMKKVNFAVSTTSVERGGAWAAFVAGVGTPCSTDPRARDPVWLGGVG